MITTQHREEELSRAYVHAVAAQGGLIFQDSNMDYGVDGTVRAVVERDGRRLLSGHSLDVQLKATTDWRCNDDHVIYALEAKTYNDLVARFHEPRGTPMVLALLCLPKDEQHWLRVSPHKLALRHCCYWYGLADERTDNTRSKTIEVPRANMLTPAALASLLARVAAGESLQ